MISRNFVCDTRPQHPLPVCWPYFASLTHLPSPCRALQTAALAYLPWYTGKVIVEPLARERVRAIIEIGVTCVLMHLHGLVCQHVTAQTLQDKVSLESLLWNSAMLFCFA